VHRIARQSQVPLELSRDIACPRSQSAVASWLIHKFADVGTSLLTDLGTFPGYGMDPTIADTANLSWTLAGIIKLTEASDLEFQQYCNWFALPRKVDGTRNCHNQTPSQRLVSGRTRTGTAWTMH